MRLTCTMTQQSSDLLCLATSTPVNCAILNGLRSGLCRRYWDKFDVKNDKKLQDDAASGVNGVCVQGDFSNGFKIKVNVAYRYGYSEINVREYKCRGEENPVVSSGWLARDGLRAKERSRELIDEYTIRLGNIPNAFANPSCMCGQFGQDCGECGELPTPQYRGTRWSDSYRGRQLEKL